MLFEYALQHFLVSEGLRKTGRPPVYKNLRNLFDTTLPFDLHNVPFVEGIARRNDSEKVKIKDAFRNKFLSLS